MRTLTAPLLLAILIAVGACAPTATKVIDPGYVHESPFLVTTYDVQGDEIVITAENEKANATPNVSWTATFTANGSEVGTGQASVFALVRYESGTARITIPEGADRAMIHYRLSQPRFNFVGKETPAVPTGAAGTIARGQFILRLR